MVVREYKERSKQTEAIRKHLPGVTEQLDKVYEGLDTLPPREQMKILGSIEDIAKNRDMPLKLKYLTFRTIPSIISVFGSASYTPVLAFFDRIKSMDKSGVRTIGEESITGFLKDTGTREPTREDITNFLFGKQDVSTMNLQKRLVEMQTRVPKEIWEKVIPYFHQIPMAVLSMFGGTEKEDLNEIVKSFEKEVGQKIALETRLFPPTKSRDKRHWDDFLENYKDAFLWWMKNNRHKLAGFYFDKEGKETGKIKKHQEIIDGNMGIKLSELGIPYFHFINTANSERILEKWIEAVKNQLPPKDGRWYEGLMLSARSNVNGLWDEMYETPLVVANLVRNLILANRPYVKDREGKEETVEKKKVTKKKEKSYSSLLGSLEAQRSSGDLPKLRENVKAAIELSEEIKKFRDETNAKRGILSEALDGNASLLLETMAGSMLRCPITKLSESSTVNEFIGAMTEGVRNATESLKGAFGFGGDPKGSVGHVLKSYYDALSGKLEKEQLESIRSSLNHLMEKHGLGRL